MRHRFVARPLRGAEAGAPRTGYGSRRKWVYEASVDVSSLDPVLVAVPPASLHLPTRNRLRRATGAGAHTYRPASGRQVCLGGVRARSDLGMEAELPFARPERRKIHRDVVDEGAIRVIATPIAEAQALQRFVAILIGCRL